MVLISKGTTRHPEGSGVADVEGRGYVPILLLIFAASLEPNSTPVCAVIPLLLCVKG
jgi:hypothetical protein